ncbi:MAG: chromate transporter [Erysipelotrichaceae bacterium]
MKENYSKETYKEIVTVFGKLGLTAFGGPAAHIAMMEDEIITKRKWISRERFVDLLGFTNLIPGPNSTEMAIHLGLERGGRIGLILAGVSFIFPAMAIVLILAMVYVNYGSLPAIAGIFDGVKPVVLAIVAQALYRLSKTLLKKKEAIVIFTIVLALSLLGYSEIPLLLAAGFLTFVYFELRENRRKTLVVEPISLTLLFLTFLKIGSVLYGSGYVLLSFLESEFVLKYGAITAKQLLDAVAVGQFTPGPVFTTATFIGYLIHGFSGAMLATLGIFLPSFLLVYFLHPVLAKMRASKRISWVLDGVNAASIALMAAVSIKLGMATLIDLPSLIIFIASFFVLISTKVNSTWLILAGALLGFIL